MSQLATSSNTSEMNLAMEAALIDGDLSKLSPEQRVQYYKKTCDSLGLNYLTQPFAYIRLNGKLQLYARKEATEQLRFIHKVSIYKMEKEVIDGVYVVTSYGRTADGKEDVSTGAVTIIGLKGENLANAYLKGETKSKRRLTLSLCGLGCLDETEIASIANAPIVNVNSETGEIIHDSPLTSYTDHMLKIGTATNLTDLKNAYALAYKEYHNHPANLAELTAKKDEVKANIEADKKFTIINSEVSIDGVSA